MYAVMSVVVALAGLVGLAGLLLAARTGPDAPRARALTLTGFAAAGALAGLIGAMLQGYTVRIGGAAPSLQDAGDPTAGFKTGSAGFAFPYGTLIGLALLTVLLLAGGRTLRAPLGVFGPAAGWLAVVGALMLFGGNRGDIVLPNTSSAQLFIYGGLIIAMGLAVLAFQWQLADRLAAQRPNPAPKAAKQAR